MWVQVPGSVPVSAFWNYRSKQYTCHTGEAWEDEEWSVMGGGILFYAFPSRGSAQLAELGPQVNKRVGATTNERRVLSLPLSPCDMTSVHAEPRNTPALPCSSLSTHAEYAQFTDSTRAQERAERSITRLQSAIRAASIRRKVFGAADFIEAHESVSSLLCRPPYAVPLAGSVEARYSSTALVEAVRIGKDRAHVERLLQQRADPDSYDADGMGALHVACSRNRLGLLQLLLSAGADVELASRDARRSRALHIAGFYAYGVGAAGVRILLSHGADPTAENAKRQTPAAVLPPGSRLERKLSVAAETWRDGGDSAPLVHRATLAHAVACGRLARVRSLLVRRTHPDSSDEHGASGAHLASARGDGRMLSLLLANGASANKQADNEIGARPLHCAALVGSVECLRRLLQSGADPSLPDFTHRLPRERCGMLAQQARSLLLASATSAARASATSAPTMLTKLGPSRELRIGRRGDEKLAEVEASQLRLECELNVAGVGLAVIDQEPRELLYASLQGLQLRLAQRRHEQFVELRLAQLQADAPPPPSLVLDPWPRLYLEPTSP